MSKYNLLFGDNPMSLLDDTAIFSAIIAEGGINKASKKLGFSSGLISRRLNRLEMRLGVTLIKRTTRQVQLTPEGELYWEHAKRIQKELDCAVCMIQSLADKPEGKIRISAPPYLGRHYLTDMISQFMETVPGVSVDLLLTDRFLDPIKENIDLILRGAGYFNSKLEDSSLKIKSLLEMKIQLYASPLYLAKRGLPENPQALTTHAIIGYTKNDDQHHASEIWEYYYKKKSHRIEVLPIFNSNNMDARIKMCINGHGIAKLTELIYSHENQGEKNLQPILTDYDWGFFKLYAGYANQKALPKRTRLLLDFIISQMDVLQRRLG